MTFEVDTSALYLTIKKMETEANNISDVTSRLYSALEVLDSMWEGAAQQTFTIQYEKDLEMLKNMNVTIGKVMEGLEKAGKTYDQCEQSVKTEISKIRV